jgi:hypothetical protein
MTAAITRQVTAAGGRQGAGTPFPITRQIPMTRSTHPIEAAAIGAVALGRLARTVLVPCVALVLVLAGWQPAGPAAPAAVALAAPAALLSDPAGILPAGFESVAPVARDWAGRPLASLTVRELRLQARAAGFRALARSGRRADLLAALA